MGIAWFDAEAPSLGAPTLRTGGLPLLSDGQSWPVCAHCQVPMLFRAQIPLALTSLVSPVDDRLLLVFECHAPSGGQRLCKAGEVVVSRSSCPPRDAPVAENFDVVIDELGPDAEHVRRLLLSLAAADLPEEEALTPPVVVSQSVPRSIADETLSMLQELGARARLCPSAPTLLDGIRGGHLVPFDDGLPQARRTTLPPLGQLRSHMDGTPMRGLIGGSVPGRADASPTCDCGKRWRTAVRLLADDTRTLAFVRLPPAVVQLCLDCDRAILFRS